MIDKTKIGSLKKQGRQNSSRMKKKIKQQINKIRNIK